MASNRAQILISAVDQTKTAFDSIKRGLGGLTDTAKSVNGVLANLGVQGYRIRRYRKLWTKVVHSQSVMTGACEP